MKIFTKKSRIRLLSFFLVLFSIVVYGQNINEFHYDDSGADTGEFVEVFLPNPQPGDLSLYEVSLYNGSNGTVYANETLDNFTATTGAGGSYYVWVHAGIQNGAPDGIAFTGPSISEFLSYEGSFTATSGPLNGQTSTDVGVSEGGSTAAGSSLSYDGAAWVVTPDDTPGVENFPTVTCEISGTLGFNCDDQSTECNSDDVQTLEFNMTNTDLSATQYTVTIDGTVYGPYPYGSLQTINNIPLASANEPVVFTDVDDNTCTLTNNIPLNGCSLYDTPDVTVSSNSPICEGEDILLTESGGHAISWSWTGPNGFRSIDNNPTITATTTAADGDYTVVITAPGGCTATATTTVVVNPLPVVLAGGYGYPCLTDDPITLNGGTPPGGTYTGAGVAGDIFTPSDAGIGVHTLTYTYTDANGCTASATTDVEVLEVPTTPDAIEAITICEDSGDPTLITPTGGNGSGYNFYDSDPALGSAVLYVGNQPSYDPATTVATSPQTVWVTSYSPNTCESEAVSVTITVNPLPTVDAGTYAAVCSSADSIVLVGDPTGGIFSGTGVGNDKFGPETGEGTYTITYTYTDANGCTVAATTTIEVLPSPEAPTLANIEGCEGTATLLSPTVSGSGPSCAATEDLIITGVIDGPLSGGTPKAIEFYAVNDIADLSAFGFGSANNGGGSDGEEFTFPADAITAGTYFWLATETPNFTAYFGYAPTYTHFSAAINGDDAVELFHNGAVIDVFGDINTDGSGQPWEYLDGWAYRNSNVGQSTTFTVADWTYSGPNALDGTTSNTTFPISSYQCITGEIAYNFYDANPADGSATLLAGNIATYDPATTAATSPQEIWVTSFDGTCESEATMVTVTIHETPSFTIASNSPICEDSQIVLTADDGSATPSCTDPCDACASGQPIVTTTEDIAATGAEFYYSDDGDPSTDLGLTGQIDLAFASIPACATNVSYEWTLAYTITALSGSWTEELGIFILDQDGTTLFDNAGSSLPGTSNDDEGVTDSISYAETGLPPTALTIYMDDSYDDADGAYNGHFDVTLTLNVTYDIPELPTSGTPSTLTWTWSGPNGFASTDQNPTIDNATPAMSGTYEVTATSAFGCSATLSTQVDVIPTPAAPAIDDFAVCEGETATIDPGAAIVCEATEDLIITGVIDGTLSGGTPKAIEFYAVNDIADLSTYGFGSANNGGGSDGEEFTFPADAVTAGTYFWVASEAFRFNQFFGFNPTYTSGSASINGDDAIELFLNGAAIDVFGDINTDGSGLGIC